MSFGINVARIAGIPKNVLSIAKRKSDEFGQQLTKLTQQIKQAKLKNEATNWLSSMSYHKHNATQNVSDNKTASLNALLDS